MCRLLGFASRHEHSIAESLGEAAFEEFTSLARMHGDGWGLAWHDDAGHLRAASSHLSAATDPQYRELTRARLGRNGIGHLRWATSGLAVTPENTHPFHRGGYALAHNGNVSPIPRLEAMLSPASLRELKGTTDSERYFAYVMQKISSVADERTAIVEAVSELHADFPGCSLNSLILAPSTLYAVHVNRDAVGPIADIAEMYAESGKIPLGHVDSPGYFAMSYRSTPDAVHVVSSGVSPASWTPVPTDSILAIDLSTLDVETLSLESASVA